MRWRYGDTNPVVAAVDADTIIEIGDLLWQDVDDAKPASMLSDGAQFKELFLGVAMQRSRAGDTSPLRVATTGVFEFECRPQSRLELGDLMGPAAGLAALENQIMSEIEFTLYAIGRIARRCTTEEPTVLVDIRSTVMTGGV
jgi:hypothetical protein